jgi:hypothetical protein
MSRLISAIMACVFFMVALLIGYLSCSPVNIVGVGLYNLATWITGIPALSGVGSCYALFPAIVGTIAAIVLSILGAVAVGATILG